MPGAEQRWGYALLDDGGSVAWARSGHGPALVVVPGWLSHLELDAPSPRNARSTTPSLPAAPLCRFDRR